jgi:5-oxoprolinase (ATP-hydrolysing)
MMFSKQQRHAYYLKQYIMHCGCRYAGILSAVGIHLADIVQEAQEPTATQLSAESLPDLSGRLQALAATAVKQLQAQGFDEKHIAVENFLNLRWARVAQDEMVACAAR